VIGGAVLLAFICWAVTFGWAAGNFWVKIGVSVLVVFTYSLFFQKPKVRLRISSFAFGFLSAVVLYFLFYAGHLLAPYILPGAKTQVGGIYFLGAGTSKVLIFLLLFFITGPGEEIFWRGFLQDHLMKKWGNFQGFGLATLIYAGVHVFSFNPMLILAALVAGTFWGLLYLWKRDLLAQIISHSFWSAVIFAVAPIQG
jgi:hypothetical protein